MAEFTHKKQRLEGIDALRGLAALLVVGYHFECSLVFDLPNGPADQSRLWSRYALMGVELFFIISGYVILMTIENSRSILHFARNRIARLYPAYWLSVAVAAIFVLPLGEVSYRNVIVNLTMLQTFLGRQSLVVPYWSLAYELWFYATIAAVAAVGALKHLPWLALAWFAILIPIRLLSNIPTGPIQLYSMVFFGNLFIAGMTIFLIRAGRGSALVWTALAVSVLYSYFGRQDWSHLNEMLYGAVISIFVLSVFVASRPDISAPRWLVYCGSISYSLYLLHSPIMLAAARTADFVGIGKLAGLVLSLPIIFFASVLAREYIELPGLQWLRPTKRSMAIMP